MYFTYNRMWNLLLCTIRGQPKRRVCFFLKLWSWSSPLKTIGQGIPPILFYNWFTLHFPPMESWWTEEIVLDAVQTRPPMSSWRWTRRCWKFPTIWNQLKIFLTLSFSSHVKTFLTLMVGMFLTLLNCTKMAKANHKCSKIKLLCYLVSRTQSNGTLTRIFLQGFFAFKNLFSKKAGPRSDWAHLNIENIQIKFFFLARFNESNENNFLCQKFF